MTTDGYYRQPTLHHKNIVFVCEDDLWAVPSGGGVARRLTANLGRASLPALSPDGEWLAFSGRDDGELEAYVMPAVGGPARRLTYLGGNTLVVGWQSDGQKIIFSSDAGQPFFHLTPLYAVSPAGGRPEPLPYGPAHAISYGPRGGVVIGRRTNSLAYWKRYRGGRAGDIWIDREGQGEFEPLLDLASNMACPLWLGDRIYFLSDHEGIGNLYSCTLTGQEVQRHTHHEDFYVREPATDGQRIVYRAGGDLYLLDPARAAKKDPVKIKIELHSPRVQRNRKFVNPATYRTDYTLHPAGHSVAFTTRGKPFTMSNWEGATFQYGERHGVRYRLIEWLNDGKRLIMVSDAGGEEVIEIHPDLSQAPPTSAVERLEGLDIGRPLYFHVSPRKDALVFGNHRYELLHLDLATKTLKLLDKSDYGRIYGVDWSPDGRWVAYSCSTSLYTSAIKLCRVETGETYCVTPPHHVRDFGPSFDPGGKYIYFLSLREFDPVSDSHYFDMNFPRGIRPYLVTLQKDLPNPFIPYPGEPSGENNKNNNHKKDDPPKEEQSAPKEEPTLHIDLEGIQQRIAAFPVGEGRYYQICGLHKNKLLFVSYPVEGNLEQRQEDRNKTGKGVLELYDLAERKKEFVVNGLNGLDVSRDRNFIIYRSGKNLRVLKATEKPDNNATGHIKKSGWIDLSRVRVAVNPPDEWAQMFREAWRLQRDQFWTETMSEVDWQAIYQRYYPLLERVATRAEFSDLMWEMQGELGTSHAYEWGGDYRRTPRYRQGFLGADFAYDPATDAYRLTHIVQGDPWLEWADSPLNRLGVNAQVGEILLAIDGQRLSRDFSPQQALVNRAGLEVQLTLLASPENPPRAVLVKTLANEAPARYREWVESNRRYTHAQSEERVGYVHIPDMQAWGYAEFHRYYRAESEREGLIVDVRFNRGGNVSQLLLEKLARRHLAYRESRYGKVFPYPHHALLGPIVALTNEYAGSDGDIFSHLFKVMGLGPLIGKRTWGGVIGIWPRHALVDGTQTTQPEFPFWTEEAGWNLENYGVEPDIEVEMRPQDYAAGRDTQLERGLAEILKRLAENPPRIPEFGPKPSRALPTLPKIKKAKKKK
jgi:tricorn protease